jgi:hypothetical protein
MWDMDEMYFNKIKDPPILAAHATSSKINEDNLSFNTPTHGPFQAQFWKAMYNELVTLTKTRIRLLKLRPTNTWNESTTNQLGIQNKLLPQWMHQNVQGTFLRMRQ